MMFDKRRRVPANKWLETDLRTRSLGSRVSSAQPDSLDRWTNEGLNMKRASRIAICLFALGASFAAEIIYAQQTRSQPLDPPPIAVSNPDAVEVLRVWAAPGVPQQLTLRPVWKDPAAWGLLMVDVARHVSRAYAVDGRDEKTVLTRIRAGFDAEWGNPTDVPQTLKPR
jgi:hypothetical protein